MVLCRNVCVCISVLEVVGHCMNIDDPRNVCQLTVRIIRSLLCCEIQAYTGVTMDEWAHSNV